MAGQDSPANFTQAFEAAQKRHNSSSPSRFILPSLSVCRAGQVMRHRGARFQARDSGSSMQSLAEN